MSGIDTNAESNELLSSDDVARTVARIAHQIIEKIALDSENATRVVLLGIPSGGVPLAQRLAQKIAEFSGVEIPWVPRHHALSRRSPQQAAPRIAAHQNSERWYQWRDRRLGR